MHNIAVTGLGVVAPPGIGKATFWRAIREGNSFVSTITRFDASKYPSHIAGQIKDLEAYSNISERLLKKIDLFSHLALIATELALKDAHLDLAKENLNRTGIFMGNAIGGWLYAETELRDLYLEGRSGISPYMASAWFPAAPQGQVSIYYGIKGYSKTVVADRASSLQAIAYAAKTLVRKKLDIVLAGGMEAPVTPYALLCCNTYGSLSQNNSDPQKAYRPFDAKRNGFVIAEGSGVLVLEPLERASQRHVPIHALITGYGTTCDGIDRIEPASDGKELARAIKIALDEANYKPEDIDCIFADGAGTKTGDISEARAIKEAFDTKAKNIPVTSPKSMFGNLLGAAGALDVITAILTMEHNLIPPTINYEFPDPLCDLNIVANKSLKKEVRKVLVISRGRGGINSVLAMEKYNHLATDDHR